MGRREARGAQGCCVKFAGGSVPKVQEVGVVPCGTVYVGLEKLRQLLLLALLRL